MSRQLLSVLFLLGTVGAPAARGQQTTTVQLPTFNFTTVSTSVSVPDGGTARLGGIARASEGSVTRGLPLLSKVPGLNRLTTNRGIGREVGALDMTVTARIIDLEEEELRQTGFSYDSLSAADAAAGNRIAAGGRAGAEAAEVARKADFLTRHVGRGGVEAAPQPDAERGLASLAEIRRQNEQAAAERAAEAREQFASAERAAAEGKPGVARIYYQMALRRADGPLQAQILARLSALDAPAQPAPLRLADR